MKRNLSLVLFFSVILVLASCGNKRKARKAKKNQTQTESFVWVENGVCLAPIIVRTDVSPNTLNAAQELASYIEKISGAKPAILKGAPKPFPEKAVWVGVHEEFKTIFPGVKRDLSGEEIVIVSNKQHLAIFGNDSDQLGFKDIIVQNRSIPNAQKSYGTVNAVYTFLQDNLGVRWFMPGELGEDFQVNKNIVVKNSEYRYSPQFTWRSGVFLTSRPGWSKNDKHTDLWTQRQRMYFSKDIINAGHPFNDWWEKYSTTNLDIFALNERGHRNPILEPRTVKLCLTNEKVVHLWLAEVQQMLSDNPFLEIISVNENDSYNQGHCTCENCRKLDQVSVSSKEKNLSDRHIWFANKLGQELLKKYPNRNDLKLLFFAYGNNRPLPLKEKLSKNIGVVSVANFHMRRKSQLDISEDRVKEYLDWSKMTETIYWRPNIGNPVGFRWGMPDVAFNQIFDDFKFVANNNCRGVFFDSYPMHWSTQGVQYYLASQLSWNPRMEKEPLLLEYFNRMYGAASQEMRQIWETCESTRNILLDKYGDSQARYFVHEAYTESWFNKVESLLKLSKQKVKGSNDKFLKRIEFAEFGFRYAMKIVEIRSLMTEFEKLGQNTKKINASWNEILLLMNSAPKYAINFKDMELNKNLSNPSKRQEKILNGLVINSPYSPPKVKKTNKSEDEEGLE